MKEKFELAKVAKDLDIVGKVQSFNELLNAKPRSSWIKQHPFQKKVKYIPIGQIERLLRTIFPQHKVEIKKVQALFNSVTVEVRLHYLHPITGQWAFHDGVGAMGIQTDKGATASDLGAIKADAVMKAAPAAESYAIKDAAEKFGDLFGANLNRDAIQDMNSPYYDHSSAVE